MIAAIHGFTGSVASWQSISCEAFTVLGHGKEALATGTESFAGEAERLALLIPDQCQHLIGYSLGARLSLAMAIAQPKRFKKLTLIGACPGLQTPEEQALRIEQDATWSTMLRQEGMQTFVDAWQALPLWHSQATLPQDTLLCQRQQRLAHQPEQLALALDIMGTGQMRSLWEHLPTLKVPISLIVGELDTKFLAIATKMKNMLPSSQLIVAPDSGHNVLLEHPDFIQSHLQATSVGAEFR